MTLAKTFRFLPPVECVLVSPDNINEVAEWCGGEVIQVDSRRRPGTMDDAVKVNVPSSSRLDFAFRGMYVVRRVSVSKENGVVVTWAVFARNYFNANYFFNPTEAVDKTWGLKVPQQQRPSREGVEGTEIVEVKPASDPRVFAKSGTDMHETNAMADALVRAGAVIPPADIEWVDGSEPGPIKKVYANNPIPRDAAL